MKMKIEQKHSVGVIIGRFQVPKLHDEHKKLIDLVCSKHDKVILFLGCSPLKTTKVNPLDYEAREQMIRREYPKVLILPIFDKKENKDWSETLDSAISSVIGPGQKPLLYGSRDSFIQHYDGRYNTQELVPTTYLSGSEIRSGVGSKVIDSQDFRAGVIWASQNQYPKTYACVDIIISNKPQTKMLLARKPDENKWRFVGGFSDPSSDSFVDDAIRELEEETGITCQYLDTLGSLKIDDWRYRPEVDKIITSVFHTSIDESTTVNPQDDICELRWFDNDKVMDNLVDTHKPIFLFSSYKA
jgi:bifunctional NMN adenylyltransferase/nudix hydrolase